MKRLSQPDAWTSKYAFPGVFLAAVGFILMNGIAHASSDKVTGVLAFLAFGLFVLWRLYWSKVEEVYDCGDSILVTNGSRKLVIALHDIKSVRLIEGRTPFIRIDLKRPTLFGERIDFFDGTRYRFLGRVQASEGVRQLMSRVRDEASS